MKTIKIFIILFVSFFSLQLFANPNTDKGLKAYKNKDYKEAFKWYTKAAEQGNVTSQKNLGIMYSNGQGVTKDYKEAIKWYTKSAEQGNAVSQYNLGILYHKGKGVKQDYKEAFKWFTKLAEQGNAAGQRNLGYMYSNGQGVTKDYKEALKWFKKSAEQGYAAGQRNLGYMYMSGKGVKEDYKEAIKWYKKAVAQGDKVAQKNLALLNKKVKVNKRLPNYGKSKKPYDKGLKAYKNKDYKEALKWYKKAAEQGNASAQNDLGNMYYVGKGVEKDYKEALKWFKKSAEQGFKNAQFTLGKVYSKSSSGIFKDQKKGIFWLKKAADQGHSKAQEMFASLLLTPKEKVEEQKGDSKKIANYKSKFKISKTTTEKLNLRRGFVPFMTYLEHQSTSPWGIMCVADSWPKRPEYGDVRGVFKHNDKMFYFKNKKTYKSQARTININIPKNFDVFELTDRKFQNVQVRYYNYYSFNGKKKISIYIPSSARVRPIKGSTGLTFNDGSGKKTIFGSLLYDSRIREGKIKYEDHCISLPKSSPYLNSETLIQLAADTQLNFESIRQIARKKLADKNAKIAHAAKEAKIAKTKKLKMQCYTNNDFDSCLALSRNGDKISQKNIAEMYFSGNGTSKDLNKSKYWYEQLANKGDKKAKAQLLIINEKINQLKIAKDKAKKAMAMKKKLRIDNSWHKVTATEQYKKYNILRSLSDKCEVTNSIAKELNKIKIFAIDTKIINEVMENGKVMAATITYGTAGMLGMPAIPYIADRFFRTKSLCKLYLQKEMSETRKLKEKNKRAMDKYR